MGKYALTGFEPSKTQQHFKNQVNINTIVNRYKKTGIMPNMNAARALYGDFSGVTDYQGALEGVINAESQFMALPSQIRKRFGNNPLELLDFLQDENNKEEAIKLGLIENPHIEKPLKVGTKMNPETGRPVEESTITT